MRALISSVRCEVSGAHCHVKIWNRGGCAGEIVVNADDGIKIAKMLVPFGTETLDATGRYQRWALAEALTYFGGDELKAWEDDEDPNLIHFSEKGKQLGTATWDGSGFRGPTFKFTHIESVNVDLFETLADLLGESKRRLEAA
jgi:hypothetical protein